MILKKISKLKNTLFVCLLCSIVSTTSCQKKPLKDNTGLINQQDSGMVYITTDKAMYSPGDKIIFTIDKALPPETKISYKFLNNTVHQQNLSGTSWTWTAPSTDFSGYMVELSGNINGKEKIFGCIGIDVSSDWSHFPRYGFLSAYGELSNNYMNSVLNYLNRLHINGLQFYDWDYDHHQPLAGTVAAPASQWKDIANRDSYKSTVDYYISSAHDRNMKAMSYNLCYGALNDAAADGVSDQWYMYKDMQHQSKVVLNLPPPFKSKIFLLDPANTSWQQYIAGKTKDMYDVYGFDGYHVDQLGDLGATYDYFGNKINVAGGFNPFLAAMKKFSPSKRLVMNSVNQYGQEGIATAPVDFMYTEVWEPNEGYSDLARIIQDNNRFSGNTKQTVLTAYMDYNLAEKPGYFSTPGVLMTDAVIFAFGGAHLELGEHMLGKEYFPNDNLKMHNDLKSAMINYYDFLTAYQNLLRGGGTFNNPNLVSADGKIKLNNWPPETGSVSVIGKDMGQEQILHLINFTSASSLKWRDADGEQPAPESIQNVALNFQTDKTVKKIWFASPDLNFGSSQNIEFTQSGDSVNFTLPSLQYWDMVVIEY
ncbi:MAG TPA: glycoside hydrolase family 66 protein [Hanamia sp.]|nr:glycoside hydrolase family 66 protein [Hanamia sp.]